MSKFNTFLTVFVIACITIGVFGVLYLQSVFSMSGNMQDDVFGSSAPDFFDLFNQQLIIAGIVMLIANLAYRILGIVYVTKIETLNQAEKVVWTLGFIFFGFVVAIVFLLIAKNRKFLE